MELFTFVSLGLLAIAYCPRLVNRARSTILIGPCSLSVICSTTANSSTNMLFTIRQTRGRQRPWWVRHRISSRAAYLLLRRLIIGVVASSMVGHIDNVNNLGHRLLNRGRDTLRKGHSR